MKKTLQQGEGGKWEGLSLPPGHISYGNNEYGGDPATLDLQACEHLLPD